MSKSADALEVLSPRTKKKVQLLSLLMDTLLTRQKKKTLLTRLDLNL